MRRALLRPPCLVSFSGGRDSSALLAVATEVARQEGLSLPVPVTLVFPESAAAEEEEWQTIVLGHLGLRDWLRIDIRHELGAVGPVAATALRRHGLLWPCNTHFHLPIVEQASGGSVVTGFGGDEIALSSATVRAERVVARRVRPRAGDVLSLGFAATPRSLRASVYGRRALAEVSELPWLTAGGVRAISRSLGDMNARKPFGWESVVRRWIWRSRYFRVCMRSFAIMADFHDVEVFHPFVASEVLDALGRAGGFSGLGTRTELMGRLFGDLLPDEVVRRQTKGVFTDPVWTPATFRFARSWSGGGIDLPPVDVEGLRRHWMSERPDPRSTVLLQMAWMHDDSSAADATVAPDVP
jgi:asparagine synthase (glutamine-hydrolysing)